MSAMGMLGVLVHVCFMLQYLKVVGIENEVCKKIHTQHPEVIFECRAAENAIKGNFQRKQHTRYIILL